ncbi:MAG TPA: HlyD family efflux transporter periplasmic adaptor subunit, partial [Verrucomicrobiae bacterium]|nr:HlyD family efflux transporter periplasmic adaptor subunit [Verrucomicrobiae bacterium]
MKPATILVLALLPLAAGCSRHAESGEDAATPAAVVPVRTAAVEERTFTDAIEAPGQWRSSGDVSLPAPFAAVIESLEPKLGDHVAAGDTVGMLVTRESRAALRGAELLLREAHDPAALTEAERAAALARRDLVRVPIVAPRAGVVTKRDAEPGGEVGDGAEVLAITPVEGIVFEARLPAGATQLVHTGQSATVRSTGEPDRDARVTRVLPAASTADQATLVWLAPVGGPTPMLDRFGTASMTTSGARRSPAVPEAAVVENDLDGSARVVVVAADSTAT